MKKNLVFVSVAISLFLFAALVLVMPVNATLIGPQANNEAGYYLQGSGQVTVVKGTWTTPVLPTCSSGENSYAEYDVGTVTTTDFGVNDGSMFTFGCNPDSITPYYGGGIWAGNTYAAMGVIRPGDVMSVVVKETPLANGGATVSVKVTDATSHWTVKASGKEQYSTNTAAWVLYGSVIPHFGVFHTSQNSAAYTGGTAQTLAFYKSSPNYSLYRFNLYDPTYTDLLVSASALTSAHFYFTWIASQ